ncbi:MAG TPA: 1-deoxy-D-xylulose-5-phosphate reductoisomerase [Clostridiaceae bacterium]|nr:1-deoxy-D-xylulose-5-phosphate reductoisomerase [Clostridiaceae bacterium]
MTALIRTSELVPPGPDTQVPPTRVLSVLGSTGSIGRQTLAVAREEGWRVDALAAGQNIDELVRQILEFSPLFVSVADRDARDRLQAALSERLPKSSLPRIGEGREGAVQAASFETADTVVAAITGFAGLEPVLAAASLGRKIALANKESLVAGGHEVRRRALESGAWIMPVDSEHSAIWQCLFTADRQDLKRAVLTCSGGPFQGRTRDRLADVTVSEALDHPTWKMGGKITIDSATLMNKAFEVIEGCHLFNLGTGEMDVVIHRQSIIHSLIELKDGSLFAQLGPPDMTLPIRFALTFPQRSWRAERPPFDFFANGHSALTFEPVDAESFPSIRLAREVFDAGGLLPLAFNAANEAAVGRFLAGEISFLSIFDIIERALDRFSPLMAIKAPSFDDMMNQHLRVMDAAANWPVS